MTATMNQYTETDIPDDVWNAGVAAVDRYLGCLQRGESKRLAEMLALQQAPRCMTDSVFFEGIGTLEKQFGSTPEQQSQLNDITALARRHGYKPNANDYYMSSIASFKGDPDAFVPATGGRAHVKRVLEKKGWASEGAVTTKGREPEVDPHSVRITLPDED